MNYMSLLNYDIVVEIGKGIQQKPNRQYVGFKNKKKLHLLSEQILNITTT